MILLGNDDVESSRFCDEEECFGAKTITREEADMANKYSKIKCIIPRLMTSTTLPQREKRDISQFAQIICSNEASIIEYSVYGSARTKYSWFILKYTNISLGGQNVLDSD